MAKKTAPAKTGPLTRADRLEAVVRRLCPKTAAAYAKTGQWSAPDGKSDRFRQAPWIISTLADGSQRIAITADDGDVVSGTGATIEAALTALEAKVA